MCIYVSSNADARNLSINLSHGTKKRENNEKNFKKPGSSEEMARVIIGE